MAKAKTNLHKSGRVSVSLSPSAMIGILLAIIGVFLVFFNGSLPGTLQYLIVIVAVFLICVGALGIVHYFKHKEYASVLVIGALEIIVGIVLLAFDISLYLLIIIGAALILYGAICLVRFHKRFWDLFTGILFLAVGVLVLITFWVTYPVFFLIVGIAALIGAAYFLFFAR